ncbi:MAG: DUF6788 family protein [Acidimicrobiales bacterium]
MSTRDVKRVEKARQRLVEFLTRTDHVLPGSLVERSMRCGKANCHCHAELAELHGPYLQWSYTRENKRFTRWLTAEQEERYRPRINAARQLRELISELERLEIHGVEQDEGWGA